MKKPYVTFALGAVGAVVGALAALDWSQIVSTQTAGVIVLILAGVGSAARLYFAPPPKAGE